MNTVHYLLPHYFKLALGFEGFPNKCETHHRGNKIGVVWVLYLDSQLAYMRAVMCSAISTTMTYLLIKENLKEYLYSE